MLTPKNQISQKYQVGVGASGAIYSIMGGWISHIMCTWHEEDEFDKCAQLFQVWGKGGCSTTNSQPHLQQQQQQYTLYFWHSDTTRYVLRRHHPDISIVIITMLCPSSSSCYIFCRHNPVISFVITLLCPLSPSPCYYNDRRWDSPWSACSCPLPPSLIGESLNQFILFIYWRMCSKLIDTLKLR